MALPAINICAKEHQQNKQSTESDKKPTGNTGQMLTIEKIVRNCNEKERSLLFRILFLVELL